MNTLLSLLSLDEREKTKFGVSHTPGEIAQQPRTWESTFGRFQKQQAEIQGFLSSVGATAKSSQRPIVFLIGAGTSDYIGQSLVHLLRQQWQCEVAAVASTDLLTNFDDYILRERQYLWISFSRSGDSPEGVAVLEKALESYPNIFHIVVSCNANGRMMSTGLDAHRVQKILLDDAVNDRGLAMTSSFSNMVILGQCLANVWNAREYEDVLHALVANGDSFLDRAADCAARLSEGSYARVCFIGAGSLTGVAKESALKVLEMTAGRIHTMSETPLGLRHGPMAALSEDTLFACFISSEQRRRQYEADLLKEIGSKGIVRTRVAVGVGDAGPYEKLAEYVLTPGLPAGSHSTIPDAYRPPLYVIFGQLLGLFFSLRCNLKPDAPSPNGVISRVVNSVTIYQ